jgi:hypothetical protein
MRKRKMAASASLCLALAWFAMAQKSSPNQPTGDTQPKAQPSPAPAAASTDPTAKASASQETPKHTSLNGNKIPSGSKVYVAPMGGFENYVVAGIVKKKVPIVIVGDRDKAEYEIRGSAETEKAGWAKMLFMGSQNSNEQASINVTEIRTGNIVFAYSVNKLNSYKGKQSAGEAIGKHLNEAMGKD